MAAQKQTLPMTLADHAEAWAKEQGKEIPPRNTKRWKALYEEWWEFAFADFREEVKSHE